jgi:hypothetical protein
MVRTKESVESKVFQKAWIEPFHMLVIEKNPLKVLYFLPTLMLITSSSARLSNLIGEFVCRRRRGAVNARQTRSDIDSQSIYENIFVNAPRFDKSGKMTALHILYSAGLSAGLVPLQQPMRTLI